MVDDSSLARLHALEWRYDGPIPSAMLAALDIPAAGLARRDATADEALIDRLARDAVHAVAAARQGKTATIACKPHPATRQLIRCRAAGLALRDRGR